MELKNNSSKRSHNKCEICDVNPCRYSCPRCNIQYCSVNCYKSNAHVQCSELFYEQWVQDDVSSMVGNSEDKEKIAQLLRKMRETENEEEPDGDDNDEIIDSDDDLDDGFESRFSDIDLEDSDQVWQLLNEEERAQFVKMLGDGDILQVVPDWSPWWASGGKDIPQLARSVPRISQLTSKAPSPHLAAVVVNTVSAYVVTCRLLKGEVHGLCVEAATSIWKLSRTLRCGADSSAACIDFEVASRYLEEDVSESEWMSKRHFKFDKVLLKKDLDLLREHGPDYFLLALSDIVSIFNEAIGTIKTTKSSDRFTGDPPRVSELKRAEKSVTFFLAWAKEADPHVWDNVYPSESILDD